MVNPANLDEVVGWVGEATEEQVVSATAAAEAAGPDWQAHTPAARGRLLCEAADRIEADAHGLALLHTREHGKLLGESRRNVSTAVRVLRYFAGAGDLIRWEWDESTAGVTTRYIRQPVGVTAVIVPWNSPLTLGFLMLAPALMAGNPVVVKPSTFAPLALARALEILAGTLPSGIVNLVTGSGARVGMALARAARIRRIAFTGSTETGRELMRIAAARITNLSLELGGNDPAIVLEDMPITDELCSELAAGVFTATGQICLNVKRIYVHRSRYPDLVDGLVAQAAALVVGSGLEPDVTMGPLNNRGQWERVDALIRDAAQRGATVHRPGRLSDWATGHRGHFMLPAVVSEIEAEAPLVLEEQFGPAIPIIPFDTWDQVRVWANGTEYGLCSSIWTPDVDRAFRLAREIEAGTTFVNVHRPGASDVDQAFGGVKQSGMGRGHGIWALEEATELHTVIHRPAT